MSYYIYLNFRLFELCLGVVCFGLFTRYQMFFGVNPDESVYSILAKNGIAFVAANAFPFLVQIPYLLAYWYHGKKFQHNILNPIANLTGAIVYLTSGGMCLSALSQLSNVLPMFRVDLAPYYAIGSMFVITGFVYVIDLIYWIMKLRVERIKLNSHAMEPMVPMNRYEPA